MCIGWQHWVILHKNIKSEFICSPTFVCFDVIYILGRKNVRNLLIDEEEKEKKTKKEQVLHREI